MRSLVLLSLAAVAIAQNFSDELRGLLPPEAKIIEMAPVRAGGGKSRILVLWMSNPKRVRSIWGTGPDDFYGDHWFGPASVSLIDAVSRKLINTVQVQPSMWIPPDRDSFAIPFFTYREPYYVPHPDRDHRGRPVILHLRDMTGEGVAGQFALFEYVVTPISTGSVFGYSPKSDRVVQYPIEVTEGKFWPVTEAWISQVFSTRPKKPGRWEFTWEAGHGDFEWIHEEVHFDPVGQKFVEKQTYKPYPDMAHAFCELPVGEMSEFWEAAGSIGIASDSLAGVKQLLEETNPGARAGTGVVGSYPGVIDIGWLKNDSGRVQVEFKAESNVTAPLVAATKAWCRAE